MLSIQFKFSRLISIFFKFFKISSFLQCLQVAKHLLARESEDWRVFGWLDPGKRELQCSNLSSQFFLCSWDPTFEIKSFWSNFRVVIHKLSLGISVALIPGKNSLKINLIMDSHELKKNSKLFSPQNLPIHQHSRSWWIEL